MEPGRGVSSPTRQIADLWGFERQDSTNLRLYIQRTLVKSQRRTFEIVREDAAVEFLGLFSKSVERTLPAWGGDSVASTGVLKIGSQFQRGTVDLARFFDPGWCESVHAQQMVRHPEIRIFERILIQRDRLAFGGQIFERTRLHRLPDFSFGDALPLVHSFFSVTWSPRLRLGYGKVNV